MAVSLKLGILLADAAKARIWKCLVALASIATAVAVFSARIEAKNSTSKVDLELVLAVDVSGSMTEDEQRVQREGYVSALRNPDVLSAIQSGANRRIAITYVEWAGRDYQRVVMPWSVIGGREGAARFADVLEVQPIAAGGGTSISGGLLLAGSLLEKSGIESDRQIVDVSGDGPNNAGSPVAKVRDALVAQGVTINGLAISLLAHGRKSGFDSFGPHFVEAYYEGCVVGGPNAFVIVVSDVRDFQQAILRKILSEVAATPSRVQLTAYRAPHASTTDCSSWGEHFGP
jgi:Mg-chelatase subunit ChlD